MLVVYTMCEFTPHNFIFNLQSENLRIFIFLSNRKYFDNHINQNQ